MSIIIMMPPVSSVVLKQASWVRSIVAVAKATLSPNHSWEKVVVHLPNSLAKSTYLLDSSDKTACPPVLPVVIPNVDCTRLRDVIGYSDGIAPDVSSVGMFIASYDVVTHGQRLRMSEACRKPNGTVPESTIAR